MPDFTIEFFQICKQSSLEKEVPSSKGDKTYKVFATRENPDWESCTCPGFGYRRQCRHIAEVRAQICDWDEQHSPERQTPQQEMEGICPKCGGETQVMRAAV